MLGPIMARDTGHRVLALRGPRHKAVLGRLIAARGRVVPLGTLISDLWPVAPEGPAAAVRTFVADLRRALEPDRRPRSPATLLVTEGPGYALRTGPDTVDAWRFEDAVDHAAKARPAQVIDRLQEALAWWRGPAYADLPDDVWAQAERARLGELRLQAVERLAEARLSLGQPAAAVAELDGHTVRHPWRENAWRLLALALYQDGRQADALVVLRRARSLLAEQFGLDPGPELAVLEGDILRHEQRVTAAGAVAGQVWASATAAYDRAIGAGARSRLESAVGLLRGLAVTGGTGLEAAREHRLAAIEAAERLGDPELAARVIGAYDVPAIWSRADDPAEAARTVAAARRALAALPAGVSDALRARLLATIALESRGQRDASAHQAAVDGVRLARDLADPGLLVFTLNGMFMQSFGHCGLAAQRDAIGAEILDVAGRHGLATYTVLGHLIRIQSCSALGDLTTAGNHADAADSLAQHHDLALVGVFTGWFRALRLAATGAEPGAAEAAYREAATLLDGAGMAGVSDGLLAVALLCLRLEHGLPAGDLSGWGPYEPWARPHLLIGRGDGAGARAALRALPEPRADQFQEVLWSLAGRAAVQLGDRRLAARTYAALLPAAGEIAGAQTGMFSFGPVTGRLEALRAAPG